MSRRFKGRPRGGLPGRLPDDEHILWQGKPGWQALAVRAFRVKFVAGYFTVLVVCRVVAALLGGHAVSYALGTAVSGVVLGAVATGIFIAFAWLISRTSSYTITDRRVVIAYGMALPKALNLPFACIEAADLACLPDGSGDIVIRIPPGKRLSYLLLWPHVMAGAKGRAVPVLRGLAAPALAAGILAEALAASQGGSARPVSIAAAAPAAMPVPAGLAA